MLGMFIATQRWQWNAADINVTTQTTVGPLCIREAVSKTFLGNVTQVTRAPCQHLFDKTVSPSWNLCNECTSFDANQGKFIWITADWEKHLWKHTLWHLMFCLCYRGGENTSWSCMMVKYKGVHRTDRVSLVCSYCHLSWILSLTEMASWCKHAEKEVVKTIVI